jgi:chromosome condensin MukBEF MukE localization factor
MTGRNHMTVQELIDQLMQIEDKTKIVKLNNDRTIGYIYTNSSNIIELVPERREVEYEDFY